MRILGEGNARLATQIHVAHGHTAGRIRVRGDGDAAGLVDELICSQHITGCPGFGEAVVQHFTWHAQLHQHVLDVAQRLVRWEHAQDVKAERGSKFEAGQHDDFLEQAAVFRQPRHLVRPNAL